jgi:hypothetical protein
LRASQLRGRKHFSGLKEPEFRWSGQVIQSVDGLAFIRSSAEIPETSSMCTSPQAIREQVLPMAGMLLTDLILDRDNPWTTLHDPARKSLRALRGRKSKCCWAICTWMTPGEVGGRPRKSSQAWARSFAESFRTSRFIGMTQASCMSVPQCAPIWDVLFRGILRDVAGIALVTVPASGLVVRF